ncbi:uncharacterized protein [Aristolochia californica]|uniref:uncharacterized protein n=1 Tax=Aristolochia californica TaxID=171875 RepID=UPI0035D5DC0F
MEQNESPLLLGVFHDYPSIGGFTKIDYYFIDAQILHWKRLLECYRNRRVKTMRRKKIWKSQSIKMTSLKVLVMLMLEGQRSPSYIQSHSRSSMETSYPIFL